MYPLVTKKIEGTCIVNNVNVEKLWDVTIGPFFNCLLNKIIVIS